MNAAELLAQKNLREASIRVATDAGPAELVLRALPRREYRALIDAHPGDGDNIWNPDTFPPALLAKSIVSPKFTAKQAQKLWDTWEAADADFVFMTAWRLNERPTGVGFTLPGSEQTGGSGQNSTTAPRKGSRTRSS